MPKYAYSTMLYLLLPPRRAVEKIVELGLNVDVSYDNFAVLGGRAVEDVYMEELVAASRDFHGHVEALHLPYDELEPSTAFTEAVRRRLVKWVDFASKLGVKVVVTHTLSIDSSSEQALELNSKFLRTLVSEAEDRGLLLAVENRLERGLFGHSPEEIRALVETLRGSVGVCLDVGHAHINNNLEEHLSLLGNYIVAIHAHDNNGTHDLHLPPYTGTVHWHKLEKWIIDSGFNGVVIFEVLCKLDVPTCEKTLLYVKSTPIASIGGARKPLTP